MSFEIVSSPGRLEHAIEKPSNKPNITIEVASGNIFRISLPPGLLVQSAFPGCRTSSSGNTAQTATPHFLFFLFIDRREDSNAEKRYAPFLSTSSARERMPSLTATIDLGKGGPTPDYRTSPFGRDSTFPVSAFTRHLSLLASYPQSIESRSQARR